MNTEEYRIQQLVMLLIYSLPVDENYRYEKQVNLLLSSKIKYISNLRWQ